MDAFIFDMDGVIVDSELHWKSLEGFFLKSLVPAWTSADQDRIIGLSVHDLYRLLASEYAVTDSKERFLERYHAMAAEIYGRKASLLPGFTELLMALQGADVPVALASSSPMSWIDMVLERFELRGAFAAVVSADALQGRGKPAPDIYLLTAQELGVQPERCIVVEDSKNGVISSKAAGMYCIGLRNGFNDDQDLTGADLLIHSLRELDLQSLQRML